ncbi:MAG TPA: hypothetical protein PLC98_11925 [Anaerolineales bacterium]|nr:hypothetical protein [Anaerolineales bacterium]
MMRAVHLLAIAGLIVACSPAPTATPTHTHTATAQPPIATETAAPPTATLTPSPTVTATATERPTHTPSPVPSDTPSATAPRPTAIPATAVPTATSTVVRAAAPVFPATGIGAWDPADFRKEIGELYNNTQTYRTNLQKVLERQSDSSCRALYTYTDELYHGQRGYSDVPDAWYPAYYEYRVMVTDAFAALAPLAVKCPRSREPNDGQYSAEDAALSIPVLDGILNRVPQILAETAGLP